MPYKTIRIEYLDKTAVLWLARPEVLNALNLEMIGEIRGALQEIGARTEIRGLVITGEGRAFAAGADLSAGPEAQTPSLDRILEGVRFAQEIYGEIESFDLPVLAAVNGYALGGGCELALCCDLRIASEKAVFGQPEVGLGVIACYGGTQRLSMHVGLAKAKELLFTGGKLGAQEALQAGLVSQVVPEGELMAEALKLMDRITANAPIALKYTKRCINAWLADRNASGMEMEGVLVALCTTTQDCAEGGQAFKEKRKPVFQNK